MAYDNELAEAYEIIDELRKASEWVSVEDRLPPDQPADQYLVFINYSIKGLSGLQYTCWYASGKFRRSIGELMQHEGSDLGITHWMNLPDIPQSDGDTDSALDRQETK